MALFRLSPSTLRLLLGVTVAVLLFLFYFGISGKQGLGNDSGAPPILLRDLAPGAASGAVVATEAGARAAVPWEEVARARLDHLGALFTYHQEGGWTPLTCDRNRKLRDVTLKTALGNLTLYVYDTAEADHSATGRALKGVIFERTEIDKFLLLSAHLPLIDLGANVGLVALQAAMQGRDVLAVEPIPENAARLCRSGLDFPGGRGFKEKGRGSLVHVLNAAVSSTEGQVTLSTDLKNQSTRFSVEKGMQGAGFQPTVVSSLYLDRLLEVWPHRRAALKIDVEGHEGHALYVAHKLFQQVDIPLVWMEWEHVKKQPGEFGGQAVMAFMRRHGLQPRNLMTGGALQDQNYLRWPFSVLWTKGV